MKAIKDFLYKNNDIIIVLLIILLGIGIIYGKTNNILHYKSNEPVVAQEVEEENNSSSDDNNSYDNQDEQNSSISENEDDNQYGEEEDMNSAEISQQELIIDPDSSIEQVSTMLYEMGNAASENEFKIKMDEYGDTRALSPGTYKIDSNESMDSILKKITQVN